MKTKKVLLLATLFLFVIILMAMVPTKLFAAIPAEMPEEFKAFLNENDELVITDTSDTETKLDLISRVLSKHSTEDYEFRISSYNEACTQCEIEKYEVKTGIVVTEAYPISIKYEEKFGSEFKKILNENGDFIITNSSHDGMSDLISIQCILASTQRISFSPVYKENTDFTTCTIQMYEVDENYNHEFVEQHAVNIIQEEKYSEEFKKLLDENGNMIIKDSSSGGIREVISMYCTFVSNPNLRFQVANLERKYLYY
ncbi:MAG: hypothetical protein IKT41_05595 [Clostridia bacterium]|nr:hypothetical protein [Clostridia bacterium]